MEHLRSRRRAARRRQRLARLDIGIGVLAALFVLLISPGLAISAIVALLVLLACGVSVIVERRRRHAAETPEGRLRRTGRELPRASSASKRQPRRPTRSGS